MNKISGYIDVHTHILPGVDDGSGSLEETIHMLQLAKEQRIEIIIATPHYEAGRKNTSVEELVRRLKQVQAEVDKICPGLRLYLGNELYYSKTVIEELKSKRALTIAESRYVLIEFSTREDYNTMYRGLGELIRAGYIPILAHVERYQCLHKKNHLIREIVKMGCYIQMNSNSLIGAMFDLEARRNRELINLGLVHLIGSDCHDARVRAPSMISAVKTLRKMCDERILQQILFENPIKVIENTYI